MKLKRLGIIAIAAMLGLPLQAQEQKTKKDSGYVFTVTKELPITSIKNQNRAVTCWCYSGLAFI